MSWYVLNCRVGQEQMIVNSCRQRLSSLALESAFTFRCERLWRAGGSWRLVEKEMFPGYVFLQSSDPERLSGELKEYRKIVRVMEEKGYLISVYEEEKTYLKRICKEGHILELSYGYKENGTNCIVEGPLKGMEDCIIKADWHRRFAQIEMPLDRKNNVICVGLGLLNERNVS